MKKELKYIQNHPIYDNEYWNNHLKSLITKLIKNKLDIFLTNISNDFEQLEINLQNSLTEYKNKHNNIHMFLFFIASIFGIVLFIIPGIFAIIKFKNLLKNRNYLLDNIKKCESEKLNFIIQFIKSINFKEFEKEIFTLFNLKKIGYLSIEFLEEIDIDSNKFLLSPKYDFCNPGNTSLFIFNNNIFLKKNLIKHEIISKKYTGQLCFSRRINNGNSSYIQTETVIATYYHPLPVITDDTRYMTYLKACPELKFNFVSFNSKKIPKKDHNNIILENRFFHYKYLYNWSNDAQIRMIFTPFFMEKYVEINEWKAPTLNLQLNKQNNFIYTNKKTKEFNIDLNEQVKNNLINSNFESFYNFLLQRILKFSKDNYDDIKYATLIPIIQSESHLYMIQNILNKQEQNKNIFIEENEKFKVYFFIKEYFNYYMNSPLKFNNVLKIEKDLMQNNHQIFISYVDNIQYDVIRKVIYKNEYSNLMHQYVSVPVEYDDYIEKRKLYILVYFSVDNKNSYILNENKSNNLSIELSDLIFNFKKENQSLIDLVIYDNNVIALIDIDNEKWNENKFLFKNFFQNIINLLSI